MNSGNFKTTLHVLG